MQHKKERPPNGGLSNANGVSQCTIRLTGRCQRPSSVTRKLKSLTFAQSVPFRQRHQFQAEATVVDAEISIEAVNDGIGMHQGNLLRHHPDIDRIVPQVSIAIQPEPVVESSDQSGVTLEASVLVISRHLLLSAKPEERERVDEIERRAGDVVVAQIVPIDPGA
jgi:hypothetical protein